MLMNEVSPQVLNEMATKKTSLVVEAVGTQTFPKDITLIKSLPAIV